jgi:hypothetical protein
MKSRSKLVALCLGLLVLSTGLFHLTFRSEESRIPILEEQVSGRSADDAIAERTAISDSNSTAKSSSSEVPPSRETEKAPSLAFQVYVHTGPEPLPGVMVRLLESRSDEPLGSTFVGIDSYLAERTCRKEITGTDGGVTLQVDRREYLLALTRDGFQTHVEWVAVSEDASFSYELRKALGFKGSVIHATTKNPISNAQIVSVPRKSRGTESPRESLERAVQGEKQYSGADGSFSFQHVSSSTQRVHCVAPGFQPVELSVDPEGQSITIEVSGSLTANGIVTDENGAGIAGAKVRCDTRGVFPSIKLAEVSSAEDGTFTHEMLPEGDVSIAAIAEGYAITKELLRLGENHSGFVEIRLVPRVPLHGRVVDDAGTPVADAFLRFWDETQNMEPCIVHTEDDGSFETINLHPDSIMDVTIEKKGYYRVLLTDIALDDRQKTYVLPRVGRIKGSVRDSAGSPIRKFQIRPFRTNATAEEEFQWRTSDVPQSFDSVDGSFDFGSFPFEYELVVEAVGFVSKRLLVQAPRHGGEVVGPIEVVLDDGLRVHGRVVDENGIPRSAAPVSFPIRSLTGALVSPTSPRGTTTGPSGEFDLDGVPKGSFDLVVGNRELGIRSYSDITAEEFPRDLVLENPGSIAGRIRIPWRSPATVAFVRVTQVDGWLGRNVSVLADSTFSCEGLSPGIYEVALHDQWGGAESGGMDDLVVSSFVEVHSGVAAEVVLELNARGRAVGRVVDDHGVLAGNRLRVLIRRADESKKFAVAPVVGGRFMLGGLPLGNYVACVESAGPGLLLRAEKAFSIDSMEQAARVEVRLPEGGVSGVVEGLPEAGSANVAFVFEKNGDVGARIRSSDDGGYRAFLDEPGRYVVHVSAPGFADDWSTRVDLPMGADAETLRHRLAAEAPLELAVVDDRDEPVRGADVHIDLAGRPAVLPPIEAKTDGRGGSRFTRLPAGRSLVSIRKRGYVEVRDRPVHLDAGTTRRETIRMARTSTLLVLTESRRATGSNGNGVDEPLEVTLKGAGSDAFVPRTSTITPSAPARFEDLPPGRYLLESSITSPIEVEMKPGEMRKVTIKPSSP